MVTCLMTGLTFGDITGFHKHVKEVGSDCELSSGGQCAFADFMHVQFHFGGVAFLGGILIFMVPG